MEWLNYSDRMEVRAMRSHDPSPTSSARSRRRSGWRRASGLEAGPQDEVADAEKPQARRHGSWEPQEACLAVLPDQDGALPDRAVPQLDEESAHPAMLVVPVPELDSGAPPQGVFRVEGPAEDPVGGGGEGDWEVEGPVENLGPPCG